MYYFLHTYYILEYSQNLTPLPLSYSHTYLDHTPTHPPIVPPLSLSHSKCSDGYATGPKARLGFQSRLRQTYLCLNFSMKRNSALAFFFLAHSLNSGSGVLSSKVMNLSGWLNT